MQDIINYLVNDGKKVVNPNLTHKWELFINNNANDKNDLNNDRVILSLLKSLNKGMSIDEFISIGSQFNSFIFTNTIYFSKRYEEICNYISNMNLNKTR